jgi:hypothetical protein
MRWPTLSIEHCNHFEFASASFASIGFYAQYCFSNLCAIYLQNLPQFHAKIRLGAVQFLAFVSGSEDAVMARANKPRRQYVQTKSAQELVCAQRHCFVGSALLVILVCKGYLIVIDGLYAVI